MAVAVDVALAKLHAEQVLWPAVTDCDRLDTAFAQMNEQGIVALQFTGFTQSDGYDDVMQVHHEAGQPARNKGYCFYHGQDLERAVNGQGLYLAFGPMDPRDEASDGPTVGRIIVQALEQAGLPVEWNGSFESRIFIPKLDWKRRGVEG